VNRERLIALTGRELRHVVEAIEDEHVVDVETLTALYRRIGTPLPVASGGFETTGRFGHQRHRAGGAVRKPQVIAARLEMRTRRPSSSPNAAAYRTGIDVYATAAIFHAPPSRTSVN